VSAAVATKPRAKSAKSTRLEVVPVKPNKTEAHPFWYEPTLAARDALSALLTQIRGLGETMQDFDEDDRCCDALRVIHIASDLIDTQLIDAAVLDMDDPQLHIANVAFDASALLIAADSYPDQRFEGARSALILHASRILDALTDLHCSGPEGSSMVPALRATTKHGNWIEHAKIERDAISEALYAAYETDQTRDDNADAGWLLDMAGDLLGLFSIDDSLDRDEFEIAVFRTMALIKGIKHLPGPGLSGSALALVDQAFARLELLASTLAAFRARQ
jgi:hypothetical protein